MEVKDAILGRRSVRRFSKEGISSDTLIDLVGFARLSPSTINLQPLEFIVVDDEEMVGEVFSFIKLGILLPEGERTKEDQRPRAYIVVLVNTKVMSSNYGRDVGAAVQNILLGATDLGLGGVFVASIDREKIRGLFGVPEKYNIDSVVGLGHPAEEVVAFDSDGDDMRYYRDEGGVHRVPKRRLQDILHINRF